MKTPPPPPNSIRDYLNNVTDCSGRVLSGASAQVCVGDLLGGTSLDCTVSELAGRSILLTTQDQLAAALALIDLDGVASRIAIWPPDIPSEHLPTVIAECNVDTIVSDYELEDRHCTNRVLRVRCNPHVWPTRSTSYRHRPTEWVLLTSGTTGLPKMIVHDFLSLTAPIDMSQSQAYERNVAWGTFYDIRRYGGLQIFLRAILGSGSLILSSADEPVTDHLVRLAAAQVTHLSGTPSHWRRVLMSPRARAIKPEYIRLSGEIADQAVLNTLRSFYPKSAISHAFASTEAGVAFEVSDGLAGFPASMLGKRGEVEMKVVNDSLQIRSNRAALRYQGAESATLADQHGFVDTGDIVEMRGDRYYFLGRRNGVINVGGLKVYPEEVESVINRHPAVRMSIVQSRRNPLTGALVSADVVLKIPHEPDSASDCRSEILELCRQSLSPHKIPVIIRCVPALQLAAAGKLVRQHA